MSRGGTRYLTVVQVLFLHDQSIKKFGGSGGIRDLGLVESAVARPQASFDDQDLYQSIFDKAAALLESLLKNHPFIDGNKRTALMSAGLFLTRNKYKLVNSHQEEIDFTLKVANESLELKEISSWLEKNSQKTIS